jgi:hypothetical protein
MFVLVKTAADDPLTIVPSVQSAVFAVDRPVDAGFFRSRGSPSDGRDWEQAV